VPPARLHVAALLTSAAGHLLLAAAFVGAMAWSQLNAEKVYVVNLVPSVAAVGSPRAAPAPTPPPRPATLNEPKPPPAPAPPKAEPREARRREPEPELPSATRRDRATPPRPLALPRPGEKELPPMPAPGPRALPPRTAARPAETPSEAVPAPPPPRGLPTGSPQGAGIRTLDVSDFPYAYYLRQVLAKVEVEWQKRAPGQEPTQKPWVIVEIQRDGKILPPRIERSSGNALYDQAALRAIADASPFGPLPDGWTRPTLRITFSFELNAEKS
jgi:protein TonB